MFRWSRKLSAYTVWTLSRFRRDQRNFDVRPLLIYGKHGSFVLPDVPMLADDPDGTGHPADFAIIDGRPCQPKWPRQIVSQTLPIHLGTSGMLTEI